MCVNIADALSAKPMMVKIKLSKLVYVNTAKMAGKMEENLVVYKPKNIVKHTHIVGFLFLESSRVQCLSCFSEDIDDPDRVIPIYSTDSDVETEFCVDCRHSLI